MTVEDECRDPAATVCDGATHTCRGCESNDECFDGLCAAGRCIPESEIVFVDTAGSDGGACGTRALPCLTLNTAISRVQTTRSYILMAPSSTPYQARNNADRADFNTVAAHVIGAGAILHRIGDGLVLDVRANSDVTIDGLTIEQATGIAGHGIQCTSSTLTLHNVTVRNNAGDGVIGSGCTFTASGSTIAANRLLGIELVSSDVDLSRSTIDGNRGGGVLVTSGSFKIVNNFVVNNGHISESLVGGLDVASAGVSNVLEFNTVVRNTAQLGQSDGIKCVSAGLVARNNIIAGSTSDRQHATGNCAYAYSLFTPNNVVNGEMNSLVPDFAMYNFVSNADFHLQAGSVAIGRAQNTNLAGESGFDIDGDVRSGNEVDVGADEIP